jgi:23S rRNA (uracil1939-C5)-methyltransferase
VAAFHQPQKGVQEPLVGVGALELTYRTKTAAYRVSAGAFFQTNRFLTDDLVEIVTAGRTGETAVDLYAGVGLFSTALGGFCHTVSVEMSQTAFADLQYNVPVNGNAVRSAAEEFLAGLGERGRAGSSGAFPLLLHRPDLVVVDPPRGGLGARAAGLLKDLDASRITYVSCDPATLARDLAVLLEANYRVEATHLIDLFPQTYHVESVVQLVRK